MPINRPYVGFLTGITDTNMYFLIFPSSMIDGNLFHYDASKIPSHLKILPSSHFVVSIHNSMTTVVRHAEGFLGGKLM